MVGPTRGDKEKSSVGKAGGPTARLTNEEESSEASNLYARGADAYWSGGRERDRRSGGCRAQPPTGKVGDVVRMEVEGIGYLENRVAPKPPGTMGFIG